MIIDKILFQSALKSYDIYMSEYEYKYINDLVYLDLRSSHTIHIDYIIITYNESYKNRLYAIDFVSDVNLLDFICILSRCF